MRPYIGSIAILLGMTLHASTVAGAVAPELRARTLSGIPVIGFARVRAANRSAGTQVSPAMEAPIHATVSPLSARLLRGATARVMVEGGEATGVRVDVYDVRGRLLWSTRGERAQGGSLIVELPPSVSAAPGLQFVRIRAGDELRVLRHITLD